MAKMPSPSVTVKYTKLFINGEFVDSVSGRTFETFDPRTGDSITSVAEASKEDVDVAVKAARNAFDHGPWPRMSGYDRGRIMNKYADLVEQHLEELAVLETLESGKPLGCQYYEIPEGIKGLCYYAGWADKIHGLTLKMSGPYQGYTLQEPIGVVGQIIPWNAPLLMIFNKISPALACGSTIVIKYVEQTPLTVFYAAQLGKEAGIPPGVLNVLSGFGEIAGAAMSKHMDIDKISFTGSTEVGRLIMEAFAKSNLKPVTLELGGKSPLVIMDDADVEEAIKIAHMAVYANMGQVCCAGSRVFVQEGIYDEFVKKAVERAKKQMIGDPFLPGGQVCCAGSRVFVQEGIYDEFVKKAVERAKKQMIGDPFLPGVEHGPQIDKAQFDKILEYIEFGKKEKATLLTGGQIWGDKGFYIEPTIFCDVKGTMKIAQEEIFGPVMSILKFKSIEEVIERGNKTMYGLAAGILTKNIDVANRFSRALHVGVIWINCFLVIDKDCPFGGFKMSGIGRESCIQGLQSYLQVKSVICPLQESPWL